MNFLMGLSTQHDAGPHSLRGAQRRGTVTLVTPLMLLGFWQPCECVRDHTGRQGDDSSCHQEREKGAGTNMYPRAPWRIDLRVLV